MATVKLSITHIDDDDRSRTRDGVRDYCEACKYSGHSRRQNIREAFRLLRKWTKADYSLSSALDCLEDEVWAIDYNFERAPRFHVHAPSEY